MVRALIALACLIAVYTATSEEKFKPEAVLIDPVPRKDTTGLVKDVAPCGGKPHGSAHILAEPGSINPVSWMVTSPSENSNCTVRLLDANNANDFKTLLPTDGSGDEMGKFSCGRQELYQETKNFIFPEYFCDDCTLQWIWETYSGNYYQCADIKITAVAYESTS
jgi:hypothetical protein